MSITNQIGPHQFIELGGSPQAVRAMVSALSRPGVKGVTLVDDRARGSRFTLRSKVDCATFADCWAGYQQYVSLIAGDPVELVWQDNNLADDSLKVAVLDVRLVLARPLAFGSTGGLNPPSLGWLECDWDLLAIDVSEVEEQAP